jgi:hypothetical protein
MPADYTLPPDTRAVGTGNPAGDMDAIVDALTAMGAVGNILNAAYAGGADPTGVADSTAAIQAAINAAVPVEVTHQCPPEGGVMPCCGLTPFEVPRTDRMTEDTALVTCSGEG